MGGDTALGAHVGIVAAGDLLMADVLLQGLHRPQVEALGIHDLVEVAALQQIHEETVDAAQDAGTVDALAVHGLLQELGGGEGGPAAAGLEDEAILKVAGVLEDLHCGLCDLQAQGVLADGGDAGGDAGGIADGVHLHHVVHIALIDGDGGQGIVRQVIGDDHHLVGILGVGKGVAHGTEGGGAVHAVHVALAVRRGGGNEGDVDVGLAGGQRVGTVAVGAEDSRLFQIAVRDGLPHALVDEVGVDAGDDFLPDHVGQTPVGAVDGAGADGDVMEAHLLDLRHDHGKHLVAVPQMMVEGNGHTVLQSAQADDFLNGSNKFSLHQQCTP